MAAEKRPRKLNGMALMDFWERVFLSTHETLLRQHNGKRMRPAGIATLSREYADAALLEHQRRFPR